MEESLTTVGDMLADVWDWTVHLNGGLQIVLVLVSCVASGACMIVARRMQAPSMTDTGMSTATKTIIAVVAWAVGVVFAVITLFGLAAVFAPLLGFATL